MIELFMTGLALGVSQCLIACAPMLAIYVAGTTKSWREGLKATLIFSLSRLSAYILLGLIAGFGGLFIAETLQKGEFSTYIWIGAGSFVCLIGILMLWGKEPRIHLCQILFRGTIKDSTLSMVLLGFVTALISFCPVLMGILTYIAFMVKDPLVGAFYGFCFGLGSALITPLLAMGVLASIFPRIIFKTPKILEIFRRSCGLLFLFLGVRLIFGAGGPW